MNLNLFYTILGLLILLTLLLIGPLFVYLSGQLDLKTHWAKANIKSAGEAPNPESFKPAILRVYYARAYNWRGAFASHTWMAIKEKNGSSYQVFQVIGWRLYQNQPVIDVHFGLPDRFWYGQRPILAGEIIGEEAELAITKIREASGNYPYANEYRTWPGPNSNTYIAYLMKALGDLDFSLPHSAIGMNYLVDGDLIDRTPSSTGWQISILGILGVTLGRVEGLRLNFLGLEFGWNPIRHEFYWPGFDIFRYFN